MFRFDETLDKIVDLFDQKFFALIILLFLGILTATALFAGITVWITKLFN